MTMQKSRSPNQERSNLSNLLQQTWLTRCTELGRTNSQQPATPTTVARSHSNHAQLKIGIVA
jgi:hypothetical protein